MWLPESPATLTAVLAIPIVLTALGIGVAVRNVRRGGLRDALVRILLSSRRTREFMVSIGGLTMSVTAFGITEALEPYFPRYFGTLELIQFGAFLAGSAASFLLILVQFDYNPLRLEEELDLRDSAPRVLAAIGASSLPVDEDPDVMMYVSQAPAEELTAKPQTTSLLEFFIHPDASRA
jgi:hypothetical protein